MTRRLWVRRIVLILPSDCILRQRARFYLMLIFIIRFSETVGPSCNHVDRVMQLPLESPRVDPHQHQALLRILSRLRNCYSRQSICKGGHDRHLLEIDGYSPSWKSAYVLNRLSRSSMFRLRIRIHHYRSGYIDYLKCEIHQRLHN